MLISVLNYYTRKKLSMLISYLKSKNIDKQTQIRARKHLEYILEAENMRQYQDDAILSLLPSKIQRDLAEQINGQVLRNSTMLATPFTNKFITELSKTLVERSYVPEEIIFNVPERSIMSNTY